MTNLEVWHDGSWDTRLKLLLHSLHLLHLELGLKQDSISSASDTFLYFAYPIIFSSMVALNLSCLIEIPNESVSCLRNDDLTSRSCFAFGV